MGVPRQRQWQVVAHPGWVSGPAVAWWDVQRGRSHWVAAAAWWVAQCGAWDPPGWPGVWGRQGLGASGVGPGAADHPVEPLRPLAEPDQRPMSDE